MAGDVDHTRQFPTGQAQRREADLDGQPTLLLFLEAIGVDSRQRADQRGLAVVDMACCPDDGVAHGSGPPEADGAGSAPPATDPACPEERRRVGRASRSGSGAPSAEHRVRRRLQTPVRGRSAADPPAAPTLWPGSDHRPHRPPGRCGHRSRVPHPAAGTRSCPRTPATRSRPRAPPIPAVQRRRRCCAV